MFEGAFMENLLLYFDCLCIVFWVFFFLVLLTESIVLPVVCMISAFALFRSVQDTACLVLWYRLQANLPPTTPLSFQKAREMTIKFIILILDIEIIVPWGV